MSEKTLQEEIENTIDSQEDLDEAYKTKAQMKDELSDVLSGMNRNDLMQAYQSVVSTPEAPVTEDDGGDNEPEPQGDADDAPVDDDPNADDVVFTAEVAKKVVEGLDKKKLQAAYDDVASDDYDDSQETDGDDEWSEQHKNIIKAVAETIKENVKGATSKKAGIAAKRFCENNKKQIAQLTKEATSEKKVVKSSFNPTVDLDKDVASIQEDVDTLLTGEELSEEFKQKATVIFEASVNQKVGIAIEQLKEQFDDQLNSAISESEEKFTQTIDSYLNYVVEEWMEENKLVLEKGIRTELTEDFMLGLKTLFENHYIEVPENKVDVFEELAERVDELESRLNTEIDKNIDLSEKLFEFEKQEVVQEMTSDLSELQKEKMQGLVENLSFTDKDDFVSKLKTLKESYFARKVKETKEEEKTSDFSSDVSPRMAKYTNLLERVKK
tara:strand:+ start:27998 stop:29317 length:1320 start_codon:yes stop_codon:yes gene_type:complete